MMAINAVIFDMDGVLIDSEPFYMTQETLSFERYGVKLDKYELSRFVGTTQRSMWASIKKEFGLCEPVDVLVAQHLQQLLLAMRSEPPPSMPGVHSLLNTLNTAEITCAVASSSSSELVNIILRETSLRPCFDHVICGDDVKQSKPHPEIFLLAAEYSGVDPHSCVVIEDSHHGVTAAKAAGMFCIGLINPNSGQQDLSAADLCFNNLDDIRQWFAENLPQ